MKELIISSLFTATPMKELFCKDNFFLVSSLKLLSILFFISSSLIVSIIFERVIGSIYAKADLIHESSSLVISLIVILRKEIKNPLFIIE